MYFLKYCYIKCREAHVYCIYTVGSIQVVKYLYFVVTSLQFNCIKEIRGTLDPKKQSERIEIFQIFILFWREKHLKRRMKCFRNLKNLFINPNFNLLQCKIWINYFFYMTSNISQLYYVIGRSCYSSSVDTMVPCHNFCSSRPILQNFKFKDLWQRINVGIDLRYCSPTRFPKKRPKGWVQKWESPDFDEVFFKEDLMKKPFRKM